MRREGGQPPCPPNHWRDRLLPAGGPAGLYVVTKPPSPSLGSLDADQLISKIDWDLQVLMRGVWASPENGMHPFFSRATDWNSVTSKRVRKIRKQNTVAEIFFEKLASQFLPKCPTLLVPHCPVLGCHFFASRRSPSIAIYEPAYNYLSMFYP